MLSQQPKQRFDGVNGQPGYKIGSTSEPTRPIKGSHLVVIQDTDETDLTKAVRVGLVSDIVKDYLQGISSVLWITDNDSVVHRLQYVNGVLISDDVLAGAGTEGDPYLIDTPGKLDMVRLDLTAYYEQTADIDLTVIGNWVPIGTFGDPFTGEYDGGGFEITNLSSEYTTGNVNAGLFGAGSGATYAGIRIVDCEISTDHYAGGVVGYSTGCSYEDIIVSGSIESLNQSGGGIFGTEVGAIAMDNCHTDVDVVAKIFAGGLGGDIADGAVTESHSEGSCAGNTNGALCGGLFAVVGGDAAITDCYSLSDVAGYDATAVAAGLVAYCSDISGNVAITNCYSAGAVSGLGTLGGLIATDDMSSTTVTACFWDTVTSGQATSLYGTGKTTAQLTTTKETTLAAWDEVSTWTIVNGAGYATLQNEAA